MKRATIERLFLATLLATSLGVAAFAQEATVETNIPAEVGTSTSEAAPPDASAPDAEALLAAMRPAWQSIKDLTYTLDKKERMIGGRLHEETLAFKVHTNHYRVYNKMMPPGPAQEALYIAGENDGKMWAHPGKFPDITVSLHPRGSLAMKNQHHTVLNGGFGTFIDLTLHALEKGRTMRDKGANVKLLGEDSWEGRPTWKIELVSPDVPHESYIVQKGEDLWSIAEKFTLGMYLLAYVNEGIDDADDVDPGDTIKLPQFYASRVVVQIDKETNLPVVQEIYGHDGELFEYYAFRDVVLNPGLPDSAFDKENPEYDF